MADPILDQTHILSKYGASTIDLTKGGQQGAKRDADLWFHNSVYVKQQLIPVVMSTPKAFDMLPDGDSLAAQLKALIELHPLSIGGLNQTITNNFDEKNLGNSGEVMQSHVRTVRERSNPTFTFAELDGKPITRLMRYWTHMLLQDEESSVPGIVGEDLYQAAGSPLLTPDMKSMTVMFIEPTHNRASVNAVYLCSNMMPITITDEITSTKGEDSESPTVEIAFTAITQVTGMETLAVAYIESLDKNGYSPAALGSMVQDIIDGGHASGIAPVVQDENSPGAYRTGVDSLAKNI